MPDEHSNLNVSPSSRRPSARVGTRRRGRRGGRGRSRGPRPAGETEAAPGEQAPAPEPAEEAAAQEITPETAQEAIGEPERDTSGDFREPHLDEPADSGSPEEITSAHPAPQPEAAAEPAPEMAPAPPPEPERRQRPEYQGRGGQRHSEPRQPEPRQWSKPADFRPAETSAVSQAVAHATEVAESLKQMIDQLDEILELVELAERQKLADEREIEEIFAARFAASSRHAINHTRHAARVTRNIAARGNMASAMKSRATRGRSRTITAMAMASRMRKCVRRKLESRPPNHSEKGFRAMDLAEKQVQLTAELAALKNGQDRLAHLVELAKQSPPLAAEQHTDATLIPGCLARLWLVSAVRDGRCYFACDSDSLIVKAVAGLLCRFYSGHAPAEILAHDPKFLAPLGITQHLTPNRRNALAKVWEHIRHFAGANGP